MSACAYKNQRTVESLRDLLWLHCTSPNITCPFTFDLLLRYPGVPRDLCDSRYPGDGDAVSRDVRHGDAVAVDVLEENFCVPSGQSARLSPWKHGC